MNTRSLHSIFEGLGDGSIASLQEVGMQIHEHPNMIASTKKFHDDLGKHRRDNWFHCPVCKERSYETQSANPAGTECTKCRKSRLSNPQGISVFSAANKGDPMPTPHNLPVLTHTEQILIARNHVAMQCVRLPGGSIAYKGSVINLEKLHVAETLNRLPVPVNQLPIRLVVKFGTPSLPLGGPEFVVRNSAVRQWLHYLKTHNPAYSDITIDEEVITSLPDNGSVLGDVRVMEEVAADVNETVNNNPLPAGDGVVAAAEPVAANDDDYDDDDADEQLNGPDQCGATGQEIGEMGLIHEYVGQPIDCQENVLAEEQVRCQILQIPPAGAAINDYHTSNLQAHSFPTLFPHGVGDFTNHDREVDTVSMTDVARHHLFYCIAQEDGTYYYPFVENERWPYWVQNTMERHRFQQQKTVCMNKLPNQITGMNIDEMNEFIRAGSPEQMRALTGKMQMFSANITGSDAYFAKAKRELESLMQEKGMPTVWFTLSAADNHWKDLHKLAVSDALAARFQQQQSQLSQKKKAAKRRKWIKKNPHIVDYYFHLRTKQFFSSIFGKDCLNTEWFWYRTEYQKRGCAHIHGCCRLKSDPNLYELAQKVVHGREAQLAWIASGDPHPLPNPHFSTEDMEEDKIVRTFQDNQMLSPDNIELLTLKIVEGVEAQRRLLNYHDFLLTTFHPSPPSDATADVRDPATRFEQTDTSVHPCSTDPEDFCNAHYASLINACQRHLCTNYCQRKDKQGNTFCRLAYPQKLRANSILAVKQTVMTKKGGHHTSVEIVSKRNDKWINSHCRPLFQHWQANVDMRLTIDVGKIVAYMTKYITKTETNTHNTQRHFSQFYTTLERIAGECVGVENVFKKLHTELHGSRSKCIQEVCHGLTSLPLVVSDHSFIKINLMNDNSVIEPDEEAGDGTLSSRMTIIDAYAIRLDEASWKKPQEYLQAMGEGLPTMSLNSFCQKYTIGKRGSNCRNKIALHRNKDKWVARFYPQLPSNANSPDYFKYCKLQLIRYRPWVGDYGEAAGGVDSTPEQIIAKWEAFALSFAERGILPPHHMQSAINEITERMMNDVEYRNAVAGHDDLLMDEGGGASVGTGDSDQLPVGEMEFSNLGVDSIFGLEEDDTVQVPWHSEHDWAVTETDLSTMRYEDPQKEFDMWRKGNAAALPDDFVDTAEAPVIHRGALNEKQRKFMDVMDRLLDPNHVSSTDSGGPGLSRCMVLRGRGGTGKSHCMRCL